MLVNGNCYELGAHELEHWERTFRRSHCSRTVDCCCGHGSSTRARLYLKFCECNVSSLGHDMSLFMVVASDASHASYKTQIVLMDPDLEAAGAQFLSGLAVV